MKIARLHSGVTLSMVALMAFGGHLARADDRATTSRTGSAPSIAIPPDHSLDVAAYTSRGMPPATRIWQAADLTAAAQILTAISNQDVTQLPRYQSTRSGALFARISGRDNVDAVRSLAPGQQLGALSALSGAFVQVLQVYLQASQHGAAFDEELASLLGTVSHATASTLHVAGEVLQSGLTNRSGPTADREGVSPSGRRCRRRARRRDFDVHRAGNLPAPGTHAAGAVGGRKTFPPLRRIYRATSDAMRTRDSPKSLRKRRTHSSPVFLRALAGQL